MLNSAEITTCLQVAEKVAANTAATKRQRFQLSLAALRAADVSIETFGVVIPKVVEKNIRLDILNRGL